MSSRERFYLGATFVEMQAGQEVSELPPHITFVPPFTLPEGGIEVLDRDIPQVLSDWGPIRGVIGEEDVYGIKRDLTAKWVSGVMFGVHAGALAAVQRAGGEFDGTFTGFEWSPHVSNHAHLHTGERFEIRTLPLFVSRDGMRSVLRVYREAHDE